MIDLSYIYDVADNDRDSVLELLQALQKNLEDYPTQLRADFTQGRWEAVRAVAHKFKSSIAHSNVPDFADALESLAHDPTLPIPSPQAEDLMRTVFRWASTMHRTVQEEIERVEQSA
jgi:HPt (histidine-containing phosphotransfer) domain-containing protein